MVSAHALRGAGLLGQAKETSYDRLAQRIIQHLKQRPGKAFTTFQVRQAASLSASAALRQPSEAVLSTLYALGYVERNVEPPPTGGGRPRNVWRWTGPSAPAENR
jgi:hypothetical protein